MGKKKTGDGVCEAVRGRAPWFVCSECGFEALPVFTQGTGWFRRCPNCGRIISNLNDFGQPTVADKGDLKVRLLASMVGM